jgi:ribonuclease BN (tRNA processing enzyme)
MQIRLLGTGDAFGSGGRFNTCFDVTAPGRRFLIDCGASSMVALRHFGVAPNDIDAVYLSHLHGDHFGGLPFFLLDAQFVSRRQRPLQVIGPPGTGERLTRTREALFPGSAEKPLPFELVVDELAPGDTRRDDGVAVTAYEVRHPSGAPSLALRFAADGKVLAFSGDTEWVEALVEVGRDADLFICECYMFGPGVPFHLDYGTLAANLPRIAPRRILLSHMSAGMLAKRDEIELETAEDGMVIAL